MTQEQNKPVRSREDQANLILNISEAFALNQEAPTTEFVLGQLEEAEARGAAEQRRKDADGEKPVAWMRPDELPSKSYPWYETELHIEQSKTYFMPIYTRPANVAALEARIAELRAALHAQSAWHESQRKALSKQPQSPETQWRMAEHYEQIEEVRAALTREGGV